MSIVTELDQLIELLFSNLWYAALTVVLAAVIADWFTQVVLKRLVHQLVKITPTKIDDALLGPGVISRIAHVVPALVIYFGIEAIPQLTSGFLLFVEKLTLAYIAFTVAHSLSAFLSALNDLYEARQDAKRRPIKGYIQLGKMIAYLVAIILIIAIVIDRSPLILLSGLGALGAILLLVFKDTILSLVASIQIASNDLLRVGDWIEMPSAGVDGDVVDIALHTVRVQNFDKTISMVPTYKLISEPYKNWRGMSESGGRRIKRALLIDQNSVRFLNADDRQRLSRMELLIGHFERKEIEIAQWHDMMGIAADDPLNQRRLTNLGCLRAYLEAYLRKHPRISNEMSLMVRQLAPGPTGMPIELYGFTSTTVWAEYESIQADIFDHLLAILPVFDLRVFQQPGGADLQKAAFVGGAL